MPLSIVSVLLLSSQGFTLRDQHPYTNPFTSGTILLASEQEASQFTPQSSDTSVPSIFKQWQLLMLSRRIKSIPSKYSLTKDISSYALFSCWKSEIFEEAFDIYLKIGYRQKLVKPMIIFFQVSFFYSTVWKKTFIVVQSSRCRESTFTQNKDDGNNVINTTTRRRYVKIFWRKEKNFFFFT